MMRGIKSAWSKRNNRLVPQHAAAPAVFRRMEAESRLDIRKSLPWPLTPRRTIQTLSSPSFLRNAGSSSHARDTFVLRVTIHK
jgi:hypothetical protein